VRETWLFVLARDPAAAKTRLAGTLNPHSRAELATAMLADVLAAALLVPVARRVVVTESAVVREIARTAGADSLDVPASGTNDAAAAALRAAVEAGAARALLLAADLPLLTAADLELLLREEGSIVIAPDRHWRGTNALQLSPPQAIAPAFGADSFNAHRAIAERARLQMRIVTSRGLSTDVDGPDDLQLAMRDSGLGRRTREMLGSLRTPAEAR
jgi:2-phospho-L-lactate guanylyltransferase